MIKNIILSIITVSILFPAFTVCFGEPTMEIISTDPPEPAILEPGQRLYVKFSYDTCEAESVRTWVRPVSTARGCKSHPCRPIKDKKGVYEGYFYYDDNAAEVTGLKLLMKDDKDKRGYIFEDSVPFSAKWKSPEPGKANGYLADNTKIELLSVKPSSDSLKPGEKCNVKFRYYAGDSKSVNIRVWAGKEKDGGRPKNSKYSSVNRDGKTGEYTYSFYYDKPISITEIKIRLTDNYTDRVIAQFAFPVNINWVEDDYAVSSKKIRTPKVDVNSFDSIDAIISKKFAKKYEGVWTYQIKDSSNKPDKTIVLKGKLTDDGDIEFSFLHQDIYPKPVFEKCSVDQYRANIYFKRPNSKPIVYSLYRNKQRLNGTVYTSATDEEKISLRKLNLRQAIEVIEMAYKKKNQLIDKLSRTRAEAKKKNNLNKAKIKELENELKELTEQISESKVKNEKLEKDYSKLTKKYQQEVKEMTQQYQRLADDLKESKESFKGLQEQCGKSEKKSSATISENEDTISRLQKDLKAISNKLKLNQEELAKRNKALEKCRQIGQQNEELAEQIKLLEIEQKESKEVISNLKQALKKAKKTIKNLKQQKSSSQKAQQPEKAEKRKYAEDD